MIKIVFTVCLALLFLTAPVNAQTPVNKDMANTYFSKCNAKRDPRMSEETQIEFCACTAAQYMQSMTVEELQTMYQKTYESRIALNKMLLNVYVPCMNFPVQDMVEVECREDPKVAMLKLKGDQSDLCYCMGSKTGEWFQQNGRELMEEILKENPNVYDPLTPIMESRRFKNESFQFLASCAEDNNKKKNKKKPIRTRR